MSKTADIVRRKSDRELDEMATRISDYPPGTQLAIRDELRQREALSGIGGWLVLPAIGIVAMTIVDLVTITLSWNGWNDPQLVALGSQGVELRQLLVAEVILGASLTIFDIVIAVSFFLKKPFVPALMVSWFLGRLIVAGVDDWWIRAIMPFPPPETGINTFRAFLGACIWIPYFLVSRRVKNTFRRPPNSRMQPAAPAGL